MSHMNLYSAIKFEDLEVLFELQSLSTQNYVTYDPKKVRSNKCVYSLHVDADVDYVFMLSDKYSNKINLLTTLLI